MRGRFEMGFGVRFARRISVHFAVRISVRFDENTHLMRAAKAGCFSCARELKGTNRHRVVVSGAEKGDGNFLYNTSFLNLKRLFPLVDTKAAPASDVSFTLTTSEKADLKDFYETVFPSTEYKEFVPLHQKDLKTTFALAGAGAKYDWHSISSGEDNLGAIFNRLLGFQRSLAKNQKTGNGILCIDEFESSLHPVAQLHLFDYLRKWSESPRVF